VPVIRVYFEAIIQWEAEIDPADLERSSDIRLGPASGDLAELLEIHGSEIDGPVIVITGIDSQRSGDEDA
jgi:hypothetical protein